MTERKNFDSYISKFNKLVEKYIPPRSKWTPVDDAIYGQKDLFRVDKVEELQFKAIKYSFKHHYENNGFYRKFCKENNIKPDDIKEISDLEKIPLIPDNFFKEYPSGKDFALWLANVYTGEIPRTVIKKRNPSFDDVIDDFNNAGLVVAYSSGTSGRFSFIPRDKKTFNASEYAIAKAVVTMAYPTWNYDMSGYLLMPNPKKTNLFAGKVCSIYFDVIKDVEVAIDREITTDLIKATMTGKKLNKITKFAIKRANKKMIGDIIKWLDDKEKSKENIAMVGAPYILHSVMNKLEEEGSSFDFGEGSAVLTGGGWKIYEDKKLPHEEFRKRVENILGIPETNCIDLYGMVEGNGWMVQCKEGHYLHIPQSYFHPMVLDEEFNPVGYDEWGRFAFLDAAATSYPGFIISGDRVKLLEECPVCDRPGPVLEPEIKRSKGEETRGCAEELRKMLAEDLGR